MKDTLRKLTHQAISWEIGRLKATAVFRCGTERLLCGGEARNLDRIGVLLSRDGGTIAVREGEGLAESFGG